MFLLKLILVTIHELLTQPLQILLVPDRLRHEQLRLQALLLDEFQRLRHLPQLRFFYSLSIAPINEKHFYFLALNLINHSLLAITNAL